MTPGLRGRALDRRARRRARRRGAVAWPTRRTLVAARGRLMQALPAGGAMVAVAGDRGRGARRCSTGAGVGIAAVNGPTSVVVSGDEDAVAGGRRRAARRRAARPAGCAVSHAFHSPLMEPMLDEFRAVVAGPDVRARRRSRSCPT